MDFETILDQAIALLERRGRLTQLWVEIYGWFAEEFDTANLKEAKALLEELA
jgi:hypothetical protein